MTRLLATAPIKRGPANGRTHVAKIRNRNSHPDRANHRKKSVCTEIYSHPQLEGRLQDLHIWFHQHPKRLAPNDPTQSAHTHGL